MRRAALPLALAAIAVLALASTASAETTFCLPGSGAGQCKEPRGVATDTETGRVYVAERGNHRVSVFEPDGDFLLAFGWGVDTGNPVLEKCTTASGCQAGIEGSEAGQFSKPSRIAVDNIVGSGSRHDVYVGTDNGRVQKFEPDGDFLLAFGWGVDTGAAAPETCTAASGCQAGPVNEDGIIGAGECQISRDDDSIAVGPGGSVFVADVTKIGPKEFEGFISRVEEFSSSGACLGETKLFGPTLEQPLQRVGALAVDAAKDAYVTVNAGGGELRKYDLGAPENQLCSDPGVETYALAIDDANRLFASQREPDANNFGIRQVITEYDPTCKPLRRFGYGQIEQNLLGLAALHSADGDLFAGEEGSGGVHYLKIPAPGPIVSPESFEPTIGNTKATIKAEINPEGKATSYRFEYLSQEDYEAQGDSFEGPTKKSTPIVPLDFSAGKEFRLRSAEALLGCAVATQQLIDEGKCLEPETDYRFRLIATNADNPSGKEEGTAEGSFTTKAAIEVGDVYATEAGTDTVTVNADVNPLGIPATGYFEYVDESTFQESGFTEATRIPDVEAGEEPIDFGSAEAFTRQSALLTSLAPGTTYRYRLIGENPFLEEPLAGEAKSFTTFEHLAPEPCPANEAFRTGASALLPDCRAYELVSPLDKENGDIVLVGGRSTPPAVLNQSSTAGTKLAYGSYRAFGDAKSASWTSQYIASRTAAGWQSHGIDPPAGTLIKEGAEFDTQLRALSGDLCEAWITPFYEPPLAEEAIPGYLNIYRRSDSLCGAESYEAITTAQPEGVSGARYQLELQGLSADGGVAAFAAKASLQGSGSPPQPGCQSNGNGCEVALYAKGPGQGPRFVCILPGGAPSTGDCSAGTNHGTIPSIGSGRTASLQNTVSDDGKRIFWTNAIGDGKIYLRENPLGEGAECSGAAAPCTTAVSAAGEALSGTTNSRFWAAADDGSVVIYRTDGSISSSGDLYEYALDTETTKLIAGGVGGLLGASEDAQRTYFTSTKVLTGEEANGAGDKAVAGKPNLYLHEAGAGSGTYRFIGTLSSADASPNPGSDNSAAAIEPRRHNGRVSADGLAAAFMSSEPLTGYDNTDAESGQADAEVFRYDAAAKGDTGELLCVSCNPSGARPVGANIAVVTPFWIAARLPVWTTSLYPGRVLAEDGSRLFFESLDSLTPRDTNGRLDVYQWEREGAGGCDQADAAFSAASSGCVDLISSGQSGRDSEFIDASPSGDDVFFATLTGLLPPDYGLVDIYDAKVDGGFPAPEPEAPECDGEACQSPPAPPTFSTPATATNEGPGNLSEGTAPRTRCPEGKRKVSNRGKSRCVKRQRKGKSAKAKRKQAK